MRAVWLLGFISFLTDVASEMVMPLLPAFLAGLGAGPAFLGMLEGAADAIASVLKLFAGAWSDRLARRRPLMFTGYALAAAVRPLIGFATSPWHVFAVRAADRVGKGLRTAPRDALLAEVAPEGRRGEAFGLHRGLDHAGAAVGPLVAAALVAVGVGTRDVFFLAAIPGVLSVMLVFAVREPKSASVAPLTSSGTTRAPSTSTSRSTRTTAAPRTFIAALSLFTLAHSSDALLLLRARELGVPDEQAPLLWFLLHVIRSGLSPLGGKLGDRIGHAPAAAFGWAVFGVSYAAFGAATQPWHAWALFALVALHSSLAEGPERALVARFSAAQKRGRAFGAYHLLTGGGSLAAGLLMGAVWERFGAPAAFSLAAALALAAAGMLFFARRETA